MLYIITGTSTGIGKAIAEFYLNQGETVIGISRRNSIQHPNFKFIKCDLSDVNQLSKLNLKNSVSKTDFPIRLINNAGIIGDIKRTHQLDLFHYEKTAITNIVAVQYLCSYVLKEFGYDNVDMIINITSGAAQRPVPSWAAYGSSKAAIDAFALTLDAEIQELGKSTKVFNLAPGVVDTDMQTTIRNSKSLEFSGHEKFVNLKNENLLRTPHQVAVLLNQFINSENKKDIISRL